MRFINSVVSLMNEGWFVVSGWSQMSTNCDMLLLTLDIMGWIPIGFLWIAWRKYNTEVLCCFGGVQNSFIYLSSMPAIYRACSFVRIFSFSCGVMFISRG